MFWIESHERDLVILRHEVGIRWQDGRREERGINFVVYGQPGGHSAMAQTVGKPAAIAAKMILDGEWGICLHICACLSIILFF